MHDQRHARREGRVHILEQVRLRVAKQTEAVAAHARPFAGGVLAQAVFAKDVVLGDAVVVTETDVEVLCKTPRELFEVAA